VALLIFHKIKRIMENITLSVLFERKLKTYIMKTLIKTMLLILGITGVTTLKAQDAYGEIRGQIKDNMGQTVPFATVKILQGDHLVGGATADEDGNYVCKPLAPGYYEMMVMETGHLTQPVRKIVVRPSDATYLDVKMKLREFEGITVVAEAIDYTNSGVDKSMFVFKSIPGKELNQNASYTSGNVKGALEGLSSEVVATNGEIHIRGSRDGASGFYVDGVKTFGQTTLPGAAIENLTFFTGGVPAMYGDLSTGAVMITTKGYFSGMREKNIMLQEWAEEEAANKEWREQRKIEREAYLKEKEAKKLAQLPK
jgi:hypothetical protein